MPQLTEQEWKRLLPLLDNYKVERRQTAYNRLVKGMTLAKSGEAYGYSRQDADKLARAVLGKHAKLNSLPEPPPMPSGWTRAEFVVPGRHVEDVRRVIEALYPLPKPANVSQPKEKLSVRARTRPSK